jgi:hypothetical protein
MEEQIQSVNSDALFIFTNNEALSSFRSACIVGWGWDVYGPPDVQDDDMPIDT